MKKYEKYFTKEYLMGLNPFRLLDELILRKPEGVLFGRTLDLGCGNALTSLFIANETGAEHVYAFDLWVPATENYHRIRVINDPALTEFQYLVDGETWMVSIK